VRALRPAFHLPRRARTRHRRSRGKRTLARVGNPEYERENHSFGITTLKNRHVHIKGGKIELDFLAMSNVRHRSVVTDRKLARILPRTWAGTNLAFLAFCALTDQPSKKRQVQVIKDVARRLGNTAAVCRKCYIHPAVLDGYLMGTLHADLSNLEIERDYPQVWLAERNMIRFIRNVTVEFNGIAPANGAKKHLSRRCRR